jgi:hypothetical protein
MVCPKCNKFVGTFDDTCQHCKEPLKGNPVKDYEKKAGQIVKDAEARADDIKVQIRGGFKEKKYYDGVRSREERLDMPDLSSAKNLNNPSAASKVPDKSRDILIEAEKIKHEIHKVFRDQESSLKEMLAILFNNRHILDNPQFAMKSKLVFFWPDLGNDTVNANAWWLQDGEREEYKLANNREIDAEYVSRIRLYGGYVNFAYAVSSTYNDTFDGNKSYNQDLYDLDRLSKIIERFKQNNRKSFSIFDLIDALRLIPHENLDLVKYGQYAYGIVYECIAHELGHICYDHISGPGYDISSKYTNIGQEYDADSFAYQVIGNSILKNNFIGSLIRFLTVKAAIVNPSKLSDPTTHPHFIDRLKMLINRFPELKKEYDIYEYQIEKTINTINKLL